MKNINRNMLHMKLNSAVSALAVAAAFSVFLPPSNAYCGVCFLPDCGDEDGVFPGPNPNPNIDTDKCEKEGFTYYASGKCPQYQAVTDTCPFDDYYLKCDAKTWCKQNGYNTTSCSIPQYVNEACPSYSSLYKGCKTDNDRACKELKYTKTCPSGQKLKKNSGRCTYDSSYGTCCTPSDCPAYTSLTSSSYGTNGTDGCEYACYYTCNPNCPSSHPYSSDPTGCSDRTTNGCGNKTCYNYKACCDNQCENDIPCGTDYYQTTGRDGCGNTCYNCYRGKIYEQRTSAYATGSGRSYSVVETIGQTCRYKSGGSSSLGSFSRTLGCWDCDYSHATCAANCGSSCYHSNSAYDSYPNHSIDYSYKCDSSWTGEYCN